MAAVANGDVNQLNTAMNNLANSFMTADTATESMLQGQLETFQRQYEQMKLAVAQGMPGVTQEQVDQMALLVQRAEGELNKLQPKATTSGKTAGTNFGVGVALNAVNAQKAGNTLASSADKGLHTLDGAGIGSLKGSQFASGVKGNSGAAKTAGTAVATQADKGLGSVDTKSTGSEFSDDFNKGVSSKGGAIKASGKTLAESGKSGLGSVSADGTGKNFVDGFSSGMNSKSGSILSTARSLAASALNAMKEALHIKSPSREAAAIGNFFTEGFVDGISKQHDAAVAEAKTLASDTLAALASTDAVEFGGFGNKSSIPQYEQVVRFYGNTNDQNAATRGMVESFNTKLDEVVAKIGRLQVVLDSGALVGETVDKFDAALADKQRLDARGV